MYRLKSTGPAQLPCRTEKGSASSLEIVPFISTTIDLSLSIHGTISGHCLQCQIFFLVLIT